MPYVRQPIKDLVHNKEHQVIHLKTLLEPGSLNFAICSLIIAYVKNNGLCYKTLNDIGGALSYADKEFYRRVVAPYEEKKIKENGDIWPDNYET